MNYADFTAQDFLNDEYFQDWVLHPDARKELFWNNWLAQHPWQQAEADQARQLICTLALKPRPLPEARVDRIWNHLQAHMEQDRQKVPAAESLPVQALPDRLAGWWRLAAIFLALALVLAGAAFWKLEQTRQAPVLVTTGFGQTRKVILPDHSVVVLNGNSSLEYLPDWREAEVRQLSLQGEAYFEVRHTRNHQLFRVHLSDTLQVQVLGTRFLATSRRRKTQVLLRTGKVQVSLSGPQATALASTVLQPGERVELAEKPAVFQKEKVADAETFLGFLQNRVVFKNTPLAEVARVLEDNHGYNIIFADPTLAAKRFTGSCPPQKIELLLTAITKSFNLEIIKHGKKLIIKQA